MDVSGGYICAHWLELGTSVSNVFYNNLIIIEVLNFGRSKQNASQKSEWRLVSLVFVDRSLM